MCGREKGVPEDADSVIKLQLIGKWISVLHYSEEQGSCCKKCQTAALNMGNVADQHNK